MVPSDNQSPDDGLLRRYLLGSLPEADAERLHELSVTDEQVAGRLDAVENDLVDAYVRGELSPENLTQFKTFYLSSPLRREKVQIAEGFLALERKIVSAPAEVKPEAVPVRLSKRASLERSLWPILPFPRFAFQWGLAAVFLWLLVAGGYLLSSNVNLRKQLTEARSRHAPDWRIAELQKQLDQESSARDEALKELQQARESQVNLDQLKTVSVLLPPPMRGSEKMPMVSLRPGTDLVVLVLPLESDDFPAYEANLKDPVANRIVWKSARLTAATGGDRKVLSISFRSGLLKPQNYIVDLKGIPNHGPAEVISGYPFRVMLQ